MTALFLLLLGATSAILMHSRLRIRTSLILLFVTGLFYSIFVWGLLLRQEVTWSVFFSSDAPATLALPIFFLLFLAIALYVIVTNEVPVSGLLRPIGEELILSNSAVFWSLYLIPYLAFQVNMRGTEQVGSVLLLLFLSIICTGTTAYSAISEKPLSRYWRCLILIWGMFVSVSLVWNVTSMPELSVTTVDVQTPFLLTTHSLFFWLGLGYSYFFIVLHIFQFLALLDESKTESIEKEIFYSEHLSVSKTIAVVILTPLIVLFVNSSNGNNTQVDVLGGCCLLISATISLAARWHTMKK